MRSSPATAGSSTPGWCGRCTRSPAPGTEEIRDIYYFWQTIDGLLGIPSDLRTGLDDHESSEEMMQAIAAVAGTPDGGSRALVDSLIGAARGAAL